MGTNDMSKQFQDLHFLINQFREMYCICSLGWLQMCSKHYNGYNECACNIFQACLGWTVQNRS